MRNQDAGEDPRLEGDVLATISNSTTDFRTTDSLCREYGVPRATMVGVLDELWHQGKIRHPVGYERNMHARGRNEAEWWRYTSHGCTRREKWRMAMALIGMQSLSDGSPGGEY